MGFHIEQLEAELLENRSVSNAVMKLLTAQTDFIKSNLNNPARLEGFVAQLDERNKALAAAIEANALPTAEGETPGTEPQPQPEAEQPQPQETAPAAEADPAEQESSPKKSRK